jgi:hypothetical protein
MLVNLVTSKKQKIVSLIIKAKETYNYHHDICCVLEDHPGQAILSVGSRPRFRRNPTERILTTSDTDPTGII